MRRAEGPYNKCMLLGKYHIVIFKEGKSGSRNLRMRGWLGFVGFLAVGALLACNIWLWRYHHETALLNVKLSDTERVVEDQRNQLLSMVGKIRDVSADLNRVQQFDTKLRLMMNMEKDPAEVGGRGGSRIEDFSTTYLPLHRQEITARKMHAFLKQLSEDVRLEEVRQQDLLHAMRAHRDALSALPSIWPIEGFVSSSFGGRSSPFSGRGEFHKGLDITGRIGTPIQATARGTVSFANMDGGYGNSVEIDHGGGIVTKYAHMQRYIVKEGQWVQRGDIIGYIGMTGRTTGAHVHYEVRLNGVPVNPMRYILN